MAAQLPAKLKASPDIVRFAQRAAQLEKAKPAIAYWCEYWIVNQLLARGLHNSDAECHQYTATLMDKLEETKTKYADDYAIIDDAAGQAYVKQFGLETFDRADRAVQANKATKQTADTFLAASTFLELLNIWGEADQEIQAKIRYAKWNAVRIVKAIKEGKDPNESNPRPEPEPQQTPGSESESFDDLQPLDPNDPEVQALNAGSSNPRQASVQDAPDEQSILESHPRGQSVLDRSLHPFPEQSQRIIPTPAAQHSYQSNTFNQEVSPIEPPPNDDTGSVGDGYFHPIRTTSASPPPAHQPSTPSPTLSTASSIRAPHNFRSLPTANFPQASIPTVPQNPPSHHRPYYPQHQFVQPSSMSQPSYSPIDDYSRKPNLYPSKRLPDDEDMAKAQKHAKWAISALNFEDHETAIRELKNALESLHAD